MNCTHYILALVALLALLPTVTYLLPGHPAHFLPALTVGLALLVYFIPTPLDAALALVVPSTFLIRVLRIDPVPTEPVNWGPTKAAVTRIAGKVTSAAAATASRLTRKGGTPQEAEQHAEAWKAPTKTFVRPSNWDTGSLVPDDDTASGDAPDGDVDAEAVVDAVEKPTLSREQARALLRQADAKRR